MTLDLSVLQISKNHKGNDAVTIGNGKDIAIKHIGQSTLFTATNQPVDLK